VVTAPLLEVRRLHAVRAGDAGPMAVLDGIDLTLVRGDVVDVGGPSGAGKTTLLRALAWLLPGATGDLMLGGSTAAQIGARPWRQLVALLPQQAAIFPGSVRDNVLLPWTLKLRAGSDRPTDGGLRSALDAVGLSEIALDRDAARLSVGQAARVALVRVVLTRPRVLLLDEPDANLDEESAAQVSAMVGRFAEGGGAAVRVRHVRPDSIATRRLRLECGRLTEVPDGC
jgi:putative ABC transport system ATP-binding protein